jgi:hypothetical protein
VESMTFPPFCCGASGGINKDELGILFRGDGQFGFIDGGDAVAYGHPLSIDEDHAAGGGEIGVPVVRRRMGKSCSSQERRAQDARVGSDEQRLGVLRLSACQLNKSPGAIRLGEFAAVPAGLAAVLTRTQPDLKELERIVVSILLGMTDPGPGTHDLDVTRHGAADIAGAILVRYSALADVGNDFHVGMRVTAKAGTWRDLIVIPDHKGTKGAIRRIAVGRYDEVMTGFQPAAVTVIERFL